MKIISNAVVLVILLLLCVSNPVFATETRVTQLFITDQGVEYRHTFLYDATGSIQLETKYVSVGDDTWLRQSQTEWYYRTNELADVVGQIDRVYENNVWRNTDEIETQYNRVDGVMTETVYHHYISNVKTPTKRTEYVYSDGILNEVHEYTYQNEEKQLSIANVFVRDGDNIIEQHTKVYTSGVLDSTFVSFFTYDTSDNVKAQVVKKKIGNNYQNTDSITWFYDAAGTLISQRLKKWSLQNDNWENTQIINYEYDSNNLVAETYQQWGGMAWENSYRYEYQYENGAQTKRTLKTLLYKEWRDLISIHYSDFVADKARTIESEYDFWGGNTGELTASYIPFMFNDELIIRRAESIRVNYDEISITTNINNNSLLIKIYPNPSDGIFYLSTEKHEILSWNAYDLKGRLVRSHVQNYNTGVIDLTDLQDGIYIVRIETTFGYQQQKLVKQR